MDTTTEQPVNDNTGVKTKKSVERSAAYPSYTIEYCLSFTAEVYKNFRNNFAKRDDILTLIKGAHNSKIGSCVHYGFLEREKDTYKVTDLYRTIANHVTEKEKSDALLKAFISPNLNTELVERFDGDVIPDNLHTHLVRFHRISENSAPSAAEVFLHNARYAGVIDSQGRLCFKQPPTSLSDMSGEESKKDEQDNGSAVDNAQTQVPAETNGTPAITAPIKKTPLLLTETTNEEKLVIKLTSGRNAYLSYPRDLTDRDIQILKLQLEALSLTL